MALNKAMMLKLSFAITSNIIAAMNDKRERIKRFIIFYFLNHNKKLNPVQYIRASRDTIARNVYAFTQLLEFDT